MVCTVCTTQFTEYNAEVALPLPAIIANQVNCFPLNIKLNVHESSIMEFPDWDQVKEKNTIDG